MIHPLSSLKYVQVVLMLPATNIANPQGCTKSRKDIIVFMGKHLQRSFTQAVLSLAHKNASSVLRIQ